jgi:hypothetical protein
MSSTVHTAISARLGAATVVRPAAPTCKPSRGGWGISVRVRARVRVRVCVCLCACGCLRMRACVPSLCV